MQDYIACMQMKSRQSARIGIRLKAARLRAGLNQQDLARALGLPHRQTLTSIEAGERRLTADELLRAMEVLGADLDYFTDSFRLVGEAEFSFRASEDVDAAVLDRFEDTAGRWAAVYRELGFQQGEPTQWLAQKLSLTSRSSFEDAQDAAEALGTEWHLGNRPAEVLQSAMEEHLGSLVLHVDAPAGVSGAALHMPGLNAVLVNRREPEGRRSFDLAHELFHLLTWDAMRPDRVDPVGPRSQGRTRRIEQLAENFAAALLMPAATLRERWGARSASTDVHDWLNTTAADFRVSAVACMWRLHNRECLSAAELERIDQQRLVANGRRPDAVPRVRRFSAPYVRRLATGLDAGRLSVKRAASLLAMSIVELAELLQDYGIEPGFQA